MYKLLFAVLFAFVGVYAFAQPENDDCTNAIDLSTSLGQGIGNTIMTGLYSNTNATNTNDPQTGYECFGEPDGNGLAPSLDNTVWFKITGDGAAYSIKASALDGCGTTDPITNNDTQIAVYTEGCANLTPLPGACNEDDPNDSSPNSYAALVDIQTQIGKEYYILVDGHNLNGTPSIGNFCMYITMTGEYIACDNAAVSGGIISTDNNALCEGLSTNIIVTDALAPNEGEAYGYAWVISDKDLEQDPTASYQVGFDITSQPNSPLQFDQSSIEALTEPGSYYYTLITFGNGTPLTENSLSIADITFDPTCTWLSNSLEIKYFDEENCPIIGILNIDEPVLGMNIFPNPVQDVLHLNINTKNTVKAMIAINNITGQTISQKEVNLSQGANALAMNLNDIPTGVYMIAVQSETHQSVTKFLKK